MLRRCEPSAAEAAAASVEEKVEGEEEGVDDADEEVEGDDSVRDETADGGD